ncbi:MAG TPA: PAS domain S-box protein [Desulfobacterales bacterium]|nr:PAS domain S-box protein [Desulfobacterales bacterium]
MRRPVFRSIKSKLFFIIAGTASGAVLAVAFLCYWQICSIYRQAYRADLLNQAAIVGANSQAALSFGIPEDARDILATLGHRPSIIGAAIFDNYGKRLAAFGALKQTSLLRGDFLKVRYDINRLGKALGHIELWDNMRPIAIFKTRAIISLALVSVLLITICVLIAGKLCQVITRPAMELTALTTRIAADGDYDLRAVVGADDEIGLLARSFNTMLDTIAARSERLRTSERRFRLLVEQGVDAFFLHDMKGRFVDVNQQACLSLGYSREELLNMTVADVEADPASRQAGEKIWDRPDPGQPLMVEGRHRRRDGSTFPVEVRLGVFEDSGRHYIMGLARDISERMNALKDKHTLELQIQQAQKMEAIGTLAGGIAHDFNNILTAIMGYCELAILEVEKNTPLYGHLQQVKQAGKRAIGLIRQILTFSRKNYQEVSPLQISLIVKEALKLLRASIPTTIDIRQDIQTEAMVLADPTQIHQVMMNICTNAYYAMADSGGTLTISLKEVDYDRPVNDAGEEVPPGRYVVLTITDTGPGMSRETRKRIFEPYFTTKEKGKGTGLGLAVVHGIIESCHGRIGVYSEPGHGTTFNIYLPALNGDPEQLLVEKNDESELHARQAERVVFVDDEEAIRDLAVQFLTQAGYRVTTFTNGLEAWEAMRTDITAWDLLITDLTMPEMVGSQLASLVKTMRNDLPVIICSGNNAEVNGSHNKGIIYAHKPLSRRKFLALTAQALRKS